jgi:hypothetical protein
MAHIETTWYERIRIVISLCVCMRGDMFEHGTSVPLGVRGNDGTVYMLTLSDSWVCLCFFVGINREHTRR